MARTIRVDPVSMVRMCQDLADMRPEAREALALAMGAPDDVRLGLAIVDAVADRLREPRWIPPLG
jgi:hypothetical protein